MLQLNCVVLATLLMLAMADQGYSQPPAFANFESPQAHSLALSRNDDLLFAVNTPGNSLAVFSTDDPLVPVQRFEVPVGVEPVSVAENHVSEVWVVNHLSDSISVVDLTRKAVVATLPVGDRPGDVVFAGQPRMAFVTSLSERSVSVIDAKTRRLVKTIPIRADSPRTLLASRDGTTVWVASFRSGNGTTVIPQAIAPPPPKPTNDALPPAPAQGIIVASDDPQWKDELAFSLPDEDVFEIDVKSLTVVRSFRRVGTSLFNLALHPNGRELWVANTDSRNQVRFEPQLKGHVVDNRVSRILLANEDEDDVSHVDLNPGINYDTLPSDDALATALAQPTDLVFAPSGRQAFVTSFGTDRIGVLNESGDVISRIEIGDVFGAETDSQNKRGPRSLAIHPDGRVLFTLNRLSNSISVVDTQSERVVSEMPLRDPTPQHVRAGRGYLFDAKLSGNGTVSCASCHVDVEQDGLAWDLGDPDGNLFNNGSVSPSHPMKGPLMTQTLRGLAGERVFHWRADRPGLESFNGTFENLMGGEQLEPDELAIFVDYLNSIRFGPNSRRNLDGSLPTEPAGTSAQDGEVVFKTRLAIGREGANTFRCVDCHVKPSGAGSTGFTGLIGQATKAAQLRGLSDRIAVPNPLTVCGRKGEGKIVARTSGSTRKFAKMRLSIVPRIVGIRIIDASADKSSEGPTLVRREPNDLIPS